MNFSSACIFIDGENLRHSICDLFAPDFERKDYLPKQANWQGFFDDLVARAKATLRLRTYWYAVEELDFWPYNLTKMLKAGDWATLEAIIKKHKPFAAELSSISDAPARQAKLKSLAEDLQRRERGMRSRFDGWRQIQNGIAQRFESVEFRRAGSIRYDLFNEDLGTEKGVDVKLATDLLKLKDIYDVALIISGDGDYVPAVQAVKDLGKHVINVSFLRKGGGVLPGGAWRLNLATDRTIEIDYQDACKFFLPHLHVVPVISATVSGIK